MQQTPDDLGDLAKIPLRRHIRRWLFGSLFVLVLAFTLNVFVTSKEFRFYTWLLALMYGPQISQTWHEATDDHNRDLSLPNGPYKTYRSHYWLQYSADERFYWLSDTSLVFYGMPPVQKGKLANEAFAVIWDLTTNTETVKPHISFACYQNGNFLFYDPAIKHYRYGKNFEDAKQVEVDGLSYDQVNCRPEKEVSPKVAGSYTRNLRAGDGWLEFPHDQKGRRSEPPVFYHKADGGVVALNFWTYEVSVTGLRQKQYYEFKKAYFLNSDYQMHGVLTNWPAQLDRPLYWLYLDGHVEKLVVPAPWSTTWYYAPTAKGLVFSSSDFTAPDRASGVFLLKDGTVQPIMAKGVRATSLVTSPSGCKVAMVVDDQKTLLTERRIFVIDLCSLTTGEKMQDEMTVPRK